MRMCAVMEINMNIDCKCKKVKKYQFETYLFYKNINGELHNLNGPAEILFYDKDLIKINAISYYVGGNRHREGDLPAYIFFNKDGSVQYESFHKIGRLHRDIGPARIWYKNGFMQDQEFWVDGRLKENS